MLPNPKVTLIIIIINNNGAQCTGIASLIQEHPALASGTIDEDEEVTICHKNIGQGSRLRKWSRGHQFVVRGGGHIDTWQPLYK